MIKLDENLLQDIIELERENMVPILKASGLEFQPDKLLENLRKDQKCITIYRCDSLVGLLRYSVDKSSDATVWSIQIKNPEKNRIVLHSITKKTIGEFVKEGVKSIITVVQKGNKPSLEMHKRLGFEVEKEFEKAIRFRADQERLLRRIKK